MDVTSSSGKFNTDIFFRGGIFYYTNKIKLLRFRGNENSNSSSAFMSGDLGSGTQTVDFCQPQNRRPKNFLFNSKVPVKEDWDLLPLF
jgi:hypothetical protein